MYLLIIKTSTPKASKYAQNSAFAGCAKKLVHKKAPGGLPGASKELT